MDENTNKENEPLKLEINTDAGQASGVSNSSAVADNNTVTQETSKMEVHHHHHTHHKRKNFMDYFFEFLMVFLAVTAGFIAENIREKYIENHREKDYIQSVSEDLTQDIYTLDSILRIRKNKDIMLDSLLYLLNSADPNLHGNDIYYYARWSPRTYRFYSHDRTILELKNSGNWRLLNKKVVSDALQVYDELVRSLTVYIEQREESLVLIMYHSLNKLFDNQVFNEMVEGLNFVRPVHHPRLLTVDKAAINEFSNQIHFLKNANLYFINTSTTLLINAKKTLELIKKVYNE